MRVQSSLTIWRDEPACLDNIALADLPWALRVSAMTELVGEQGLRRELEDGVDDTATGVSGRTDDGDGWGHGVWVRCSRYVASKVVRR
jgi:hypothetical protein